MAVERALRRPRDEHYRQTMAHVFSVSSAIHIQNPFNRIDREMLYLISICTRQQEAIADLEERLDELTDRDVSNRSPTLSPSGTLYW